MNNSINLDNAGFSKDNMTCIRFVTGLMKILYQGDPDKENGILSGSEFMQSLRKKLSFGMKPVNLMADIENHSYFTLLDKMARRVWTENREVLFSSRIFEERAFQNFWRMGARRTRALQRIGTGSFSDEEKRCISVAALTICRRFKDSNFKWEVSEDFWFRMKVERRIGRKKWVETEFLTEAKEEDNFEVQYKLETSEPSSFVARDLRSVLIAILLPMRLLDPNQIFLESLVDRVEEAHQLFDKLYDILSTVLMVVGHVQPQKQLKLKTEKEKNSSEHAFGSLINLVFQAYSAWKEDKNIGMFSESNFSVEESSLLEDKWSEFKKFDTLRDFHSKKVIRLIQNLGFNAKLELLSKSKHSWRGAEFMLMDNPGNVKKPKGRSCKYADAFFYETEFTPRGYDLWVKRLNIVKDFLSGVEGRGKYVDFQSNDPKTASYIYWIIMSNVKRVEKKINFFKINNVVKYRKKVEEILNILKTREDNGGQPLPRPKKRRSAEGSTKDEPQKLKNIKSEKV